MRQLLFQCIVEALGLDLFRCRKETALLRQGEQEEQERKTFSVKQKRWQLNANAKKYWKCFHLRNVIIC
jgi:hypothetical protein